MVLLQYYTQYINKFGRPNSGHRTEEKSAFFPILKKGSAKEFSKY